uniref:Uncharacterized protein n=1 Tax=Angiostrongylus cantonensis TaxID=6313 RepID=A0A0K0DRD1_ANGCA
MKERVDLNSNGLCIESRARVLKNGKWVKRYILCKKPSDVSSPILYVYKSKKNRKCNNSNVSLVLKNYVGFESGECPFRHFRHRINIIGVTESHLVCQIRMQSTSKLCLMKTNAWRITHGMINAESFIPYCFRFIINISIFCFRFVSSHPSFTEDVLCPCGFSCCLKNFSCSSRMSLNLD